MIDLATPQRRALIDIQRSRVLTLRAHQRLVSQTRLVDATENLRNLRDKTVVVVRVNPHRLHLTLVLRQPGKLVRVRVVEKTFKAPCHLLTKLGLHVRLILVVLNPMSTFMTLKGSHPSSNVAHDKVNEPLKETHGSLVWPLITKVHNL